MEHALIDNLKRIAKQLQAQDSDDWQFVYRAAVRLEGIDAVFPGFNSGCDAEVTVFPAEAIHPSVKLTKGGLEIEEGQK